MNANANHNRRAVYVMTNASPNTVQVFHRANDGARAIAEMLFTAVLVLSSLYIAFNEGLSNWQSLWTCGIYLLLALTLSRARVAQTQE